MKAFFRIIALSCALLAGGALSAGAQTPNNPSTIHWQTSVDAAQRTAGQTNRLVLMHFWAPWCKPCLRLDSDVFSQPQFGAALESNYVPVKLNADEARAIAKQYGITQLPVDVIITPAGKLVTILPSPPNPEKYITQLNDVAAGHKKLAGGSYAEAANTPVSAPAAQSPAVAAAPPAAPAAAATGDRYADYYNRTSPAGAPATPAAYAPPAVAAGAPQQPASYPAQQPPAAGGYYPQQPGGGPPGDPAAAPPGAQPYAPGAPAYGQQPGAAPASAYGQPPMGQPNATQASANPAYPGQQNPGQPYAVQPANGTAPPANPAGAPGNPAAQAGWFGGRVQPEPGGLVSDVMSRQQPAPVAPSAPQLPPGSPPLGLEGYCPVTLVMQKKWVLGDKRWGARHRDRTYLFVGEEEQKRFLANPDSFSPVMSGNDPVLALDQAQTVPGTRKFGLFMGGRIYLFNSEESLGQFMRNPKRYAAESLQARR